MTDHEHSSAKLDVRIRTAAAELQEASAALMRSMAAVMDEFATRKAMAEKATASKPAATSTGKKRGRPRKTPAPVEPEQAKASVEPTAAVEPQEPEPKPDTPAVDVKALKSAQRERIKTTYLEPLKDIFGIKKVRQLCAGRKLADVPDDDLDALENAAQASLNAASD